MTTSLKKTVQLCFSSSKLVAQARKVANMLRQIIHTGFYDSSFSMRRTRKPVKIRVLFNSYHGMVIPGNDFYY